jgi:hypothetical protein
MRSKSAAWIATLTVIGAAIVLFLLFPGALAFAELAAQEIRIFWWLILLIFLSLYLIFVLGRKKPQR